jgi:hypothetical protein
MMEMETVWTRKLILLLLDDPAMMILVVPSSPTWHA